MTAPVEPMRFYLGRAYDPEAQQVLEGSPVLYDARDLTTHAVCIGMTGSGKTGLGIGLLEEAILDGLPVLVLDPKGDMTNLLLNFPHLSPAEFEPWVNAQDAQRRGQSTAEYAQEVAATWTRGLADWGLGTAQVLELREKAEFAIYTPGSDAGLSVNILHSLRMPDLSWDDDEEYLRELIANTVSALLALAGIEADPVRGREHILLAHLVEDAWRRGRDLDLVALIEGVQRPPMRKVGVFDLDTFFPERDRYELARALNNVVASPSFENWLEGPPLDVGALLTGAGNKARVSVFYLAHLSEVEQMFFVTLLLGRVSSWMRKLPGSTTLRALLYFDEVFGYLPPHPANPPSKRPLLSLLKTARAFGLGLVLATQNPVDLDYKALGNAGTWFVGKLQTERDKARLLDGMEGLGQAGGLLVDRAYLDRLVSSLQPRVFILHNVHQQRPIVFKTRWTLSYLRGPLTRTQVRELMRPLKESGGLLGSRPPFSLSEEQGAARGLAQPPDLPRGYSFVQPQVHARVACYFMPVELSEERAVRRVVGSGNLNRVLGVQLAYEPYLYAAASVLYASVRGSSSRTEDLVCLAPLPDAHGLVPWASHVVVRELPEGVSSTPYEGTAFAPLPGGMADSPPYTRLRQALVEHIYRERGLVTWAHPQLRLRAYAGEGEREFNMRCQEEARRRRDKELARLEQRYTRTLDRWSAQLAREERELKQDRVEYSGRKRDELFSAGESLATLLLGRRSSRRLREASTRRRLTSEARADVRESEEAIAYLREQIEAVEAEKASAEEEVRARWADIAIRVEETLVRPRKSDISLPAFGIAWIPCWLVTVEDAPGARTWHRVLAYKV